VFEVKPKSKTFLSIICFPKIRRPVYWLLNYELQDFDLDKVSGLPWYEIQTKSTIDYSGTLGMF